MVRVEKQRVRLGRQDWVGIGSLALAIVALAGATLHKVHELAQTNRERLAAVDAEIAGLSNSVRLLQSDVRELARRGRP